MRAVQQLYAFASLTALASAFMPFGNPPASWGASQYNMTLSSMSMFCNSSGPLNSVPASFGVASIDWSNQKTQWAPSAPMDCNERLAAQAAAIKAASPSTHVFTYRNLVKALPWFTEVRLALEDPAYAGFFLRFRPGGPAANNTHVPRCDTTYDPPLCSDFYHDQSQSPAVPSPSNPNPDGRCVGHCDCGSVPCGEYLWDWRNGTQLTDWIIAKHIGGPLGLDHPAISGFFIDDFWCSNLINGTGACGDPVQGPTEVDAHNQADMALSDADVAALTRGWLAGFTAAQRAIAARGGYTWSRIPGQDNANAEPVIVDAGSCAARMAQACVAAPPWRDAPLLHGLNFNSSGGLPSVDADIAAFLLMRGPWAFTGAGYWGMSWPTGATWNSSNIPRDRPAQMDADFGAPLDAACAPAGGGGHRFSRRYERTTVTLDCATYTATFQPPLW